MLSHVATQRPQGADGTAGGYAPRYLEGPVVAGAYYAYWSGVPVTGVRLIIRPRVTASSVEAWQSDPGRRGVSTAAAGRGCRSAPEQSPVS